MCDCEDRPCCGCYSIADLYSNSHDPNDPNNWQKGNTPMNEYYADEDVFFEDEEPLTPEEQAAADRAWYRQQEQEAYAEFLQSPYCFDEG